METVRRGVVAFPEAAALVLLALAVAVAATVTAAVFRPWLAVAVALLVLGALWWLSPPRAPSAQPSVLATGVAVAGAVAWMLVQLRYTGENIAVDRDPAVYALAGAWLVDHPSVTVPTAEAAQAAAAVPGARTAGLGFGGSADSLAPEFVHTVPGIVAVAGWVGGLPALLAANVVIGAVALLAVFSLGRAVAGDWWGLLPPAALAVAMPLAGFSRSTYSEPLSLVLIATGSGLLLSLVAGRSRSPLRSAVLVGTYLGAVGIVRIDGALVAAGGLAALATWFVLDPPTRRDGWTRLTAVALPSVALVGLGMADMALGSGTYLSRLAGQAAAVTGALAVAAAVAAGTVVLAPRLHAWLQPRQRTVAASAAALVVAGSAVLLSRPWWMTARTFADNRVMVRDIERYQAREGLPLDGTRSYDEYSVEWLSWYHGWIAVLLGLAGVAVLVYLAVSGRRPALVALLPLAAVAVLYLVRPSITPDHVWAMRRLVTGAVPLLLVGATALLALLGRRGRLGAVAAVAGALAVGVWPLTAWSGLGDVRDRVGQVEEAQAACDSIAGGRVVLAGGAPGVDYLPTLRIVCDAQVVQLTQATSESLATLREAWDGQPLSLVTFDVERVPWTARPDAPVHRARIEMWERSLVGAPSAPTVWRRLMWAGVVQLDGRVEPLGSASAQG